VKSVSAFLDSFHAGAAGYLTNKHGFDWLGAAIHLAHSGVRPVSPDMLEKRPVISEMPVIARLLTLPDLSKREREVFDLLWRALPDKIIARHLQIVENTLRGIKRGLFAKLNVHSRAEILAKYGLGIGQ
jgi:DNA-binding NarL/FixJ family response regulator